MTARAADELTLAFLELRHRGLTSLDIALLFGVTAERVRTATVRVAKDDTATGDDTNGFYAWLGDRRPRSAR